MPIIKRYLNRKLYNTNAKQYITLEGIAELIRAGDEIQVVENATGEDITAVTLTQIIFEREKKQSGFLPRSILASLIKTGGDRLGAIQHTLMSSLGLWQHFDEEIERRVEILVSSGELTQEEGQIIQSKLLSGSLLPNEENTPPLLRMPTTSEILEKQLHKLQVPTKNDLQELHRQIDGLAEKIDSLA